MTFTFTDSGVIAAGETDTGYEIDGTVLTITDGGTYAVSGSCADGSIQIKKRYDRRDAGAGWPDTYE